MPNPTYVEYVINGDFELFAVDIVNSEGEPPEGVNDHYIVVNHFPTKPLPHLRYAPDVITRYGNMICFVKLPDDLWGLLIHDEPELREAFVRIAYDAHMRAGQTP